MIGGMHASFAVASALILAALAIFALGRALSKAGERA